MTDLSSIFANDDAVFDLEFTDQDGKPTGVVWKIRSLKNPDSEAALRKKRNLVFGKRALDSGDIDPEEIGELTFMQANDPSDEQLAYCVTGWEWGDNTFGKFDLKYSHKNVLAIIKSVPKIREKVLAKAIAITDFTPA